MSELIPPGNNSHCARLKKRVIESGYRTDQKLYLGGSREGSLTKDPVGMTQGDQIRKYWVIECG